MPRTKQEESVLIKLGQRIAAARLAAGLTPEELARRTNLNRSYVRKLENGQGNPSFLVMIALAKALRVDLSELFKK